MKIGLKCNKLREVKEEKAGETVITYYYYLQNLPEGLKLTLRSEKKLPIKRDDEFCLKALKSQQEITATIGEKK